jgi:hypothetical protein
MVFNATFNNISVISLWSVLLMEETRVSKENHRPAASHWKTLSHNVVSSTPCQLEDQNNLINISYLIRFFYYFCWNIYLTTTRPKTPNENFFNYIVERTIILHFDEMMMMFTLYYDNTLRLIFKCSFNETSLWVDMWLHSWHIILVWFWAN